ncbi:J domain-containing protein [Natronobiforma cellulositropha]|uniref:J domain-containing protein n=1 Tax=Natronobiforma cellulositropha TaxID=1679076 RepID=UPI0021D574B1|nr:DnaJ domain-containing protein [Natronobiforma cellulositropha]
MERHYDVLGVTPEADRADVRLAYRALLKECHPDQGGSRLEFLRLKRAYEAITGERAPEEGETDGGAVPSGQLGAGTDPTFEPSPRPRDRPGGTGAGLRNEGELLSVTLVGLVPDLQLRSIVSGRLSPSLQRAVAFFEVENVSDRTLEWSGRSNTSFIGDDGFLYEGANILRPHADSLPSPWCVTDVELEPGRAVNGVVVAGEVPDGTAIDRVVYTQHATSEDGRGSDETERYLFEIKPRIRDALEYVPFAVADPDEASERRARSADEANGADGTDEESPSYRIDVEFDGDSDGDVSFDLE